MVQVTPNPGLPEQTIISQYSTSPTIVQLINNMDAYINPDADFDAFFDFCFNVDTAQGFGLDNWGTIVNVSRQLTIPGDATNLGFKEGLNYQPFGQAPFYNGTPDTNTYTLVDSAYRTLILVKALANISNCTAPSLNQLLQNLFAGRGRCYVSDTGGMQMLFTFEFSLYPYEIAILTQSGAVPRPAAVNARILQLDLPTTFGFIEASTGYPRLDSTFILDETPLWIPSASGGQMMQPFGQGVLFNGATGLQQAA
jgi:hypothetical protein